MKLKLKVPQEQEPPNPAEQATETARTEEGFLESLKSHVGRLQDAKIGADGLAGVLHFLEAEGYSLDDFLDISLEHMAGGLYEVALLLFLTLRRETDMMEREISARRKRVGRGATARVRHRSA